MEEKRKPLGEILKARGFVTGEQIEAALKYQNKEGLKIGQALIRLGFVKPRDVLEALAEQLGLRTIDLGEMEISPSVIELVPQTVARRHNLVPISASEGKVVVAVSEPLDLESLDNLRFILNADVECVLSEEEGVSEALTNYYGSQAPLETAVDEAYRDFTDGDIQVVEEEELEEGEVGADEGPVVRLVQKIIEDAIRSRASDIHIEPMEDKLRIRYRIDGVCQEIEAPPRRLQEAVIARVKIMAGMKIDEKRRPQDGSISMRFEGRDIDFRVSALPAWHGESVVLRILDKITVLRGVETLGFHEDDYRRFQNIIRQPAGIFLVTGPTGSGKTTTLYAALNELNRPDVKILSAEDPVEYNISGINQVEVLVEVGRTFANILRAMMRQAPDVILVGEIRDTEAAEVAIHAALTGHLVFSTLHTNDAPSALPRLIDLGVKPFLVASAIQAVMAQRLVRRICENCKEPTEVTDQELYAVGLKREDVEGVTFYRGRGCQKCFKSGFFGRVGIFELMEMNAEIREMAFQKASTDGIRRQARSSGMLTLLEDGVRKAMSGITTLDEVIRVAVRGEV
ncbi:MAG: pilus assembly protein PilB [Planctomycetes bacterium DG_23]|nr:MAG: pilus assembly protein PilB [Planctomycetes bacterium DG_23]